MKGQFRTGSVAGTGSAINVELGFTPDWVKVFNPNDAGTVDATMEWLNGMPNGSGFKSTATAGPVYVTANGISAYAGTEAGASAGFTIGADADLNASGETMVWIAAANSE